MLLRLGNAIAMAKPMAQITTVAGNEHLWLSLL
jgi:hypothetical protein